MNAIAEKRRGFGYWHIGVMLARDGMIRNDKKLYRIYREEGLSVRRRRGRNRARGSRTAVPVPLQPNQRWSLDFVSDTFDSAEISAFWRSTTIAAAKTYAWFQTQASPGRELHGR